MPPQSQKKKSIAAQQFVPVKEVRGGIMIMKDGSLVGALLASSVNFALKSEDEQAAIIGQFQNFLNSLDFSVQLFMQSRKLDIRPYVALLEERLKAQNEELMKIQVREYIEFVKAFVEQATIMSKRFFVLVPYSPPTINIQKEFQGKILGGGAGESTVKKGSFEEHRTQLEQRISIVQGGLAGTGVRTAQLGTEEVIELLYKEFNPGELEKPITLQQSL